MGKDVIGHKCVIEHGDISHAQFFDPFTHVYMFDIGFPPKLFKKLSTMWNRSQSMYLICYHSPRIMITRYCFDLELLVQSSTLMHGSSEDIWDISTNVLKPKIVSRGINECPVP